MGDYHFSQGDGEITFCGAIEMAGWMDLHVDLIKGGVGKYGLSKPMFKVSPVDPHYGDFLVFEGDQRRRQDGKQLLQRRDHGLSAGLPERHQLSVEVRLLERAGLRDPGCAPVEGRIGGVVDIPNACVSVAIPSDMFEFDIKPNAQGPQKHVDSSKADMARAS